MRQRATAGEIPQALHHTWWFPLAFVALTIVALTATPVVVSMRVQRVRTALSDGTNVARVLVNDLEVAVATQALALQRHDATSAADAAKAARRERMDELALDSVMVRVGPDAVEQFAQIRILVREWQQHPHAGTEGTRTPTEVLAASEALDGMLQRRADAQRARIHSLEHANVVSAVVLAPLALLATALLFWVGQRILFLAREATAGRAALAAALEEKSALLRGVTHDLKNPLGAVYGYGELLADGVLGELRTEQQDVVVRMQRLVTRALGTVSDLLDLYRDQSGTIAIERVREVLDAIVEESVSDFAALARRANLTLRFVPAGASAMVSTDPVRVREILSNLLSNAVKYTPAGGDIVVTVQPASNGPAHRMHRVAVHNTGPGIPAELQERVFDEFYRLPSSAGVPGTGVGLAISRRLARLLGGDLMLESAPGAGATFTLLLPADG